MLEKRIINVETTPNRLTKAKGTEYSEVSQAVKATAIRAAIKADQELRRRHPDKTDISDVDAVRRAAEDYENQCAQLGRIPSFLGLCAALGISRQWLYQYCERNPHSETTEFLDRLRHQWAGTRQQMGELRLTSEALSIFMLKNSKLGLTDKAEVEVSQARNPLDDLHVSEEELRKRYLDAIPWDDIDEEEPEGGALQNE